MYGQYPISNTMYAFPQRDVVMHEFQCESPRSLNMCWTSGDVHCSLAQAVYEPKRLSIWDVHMMTPPMTPRDVPLDYRRFSGMAMSISSPTPTLTSFLPERLGNFNNTIPFPALPPPNAWDPTQAGVLDQQLLGDHKSICDVVMDIEMASTPTMPYVPLPVHPSNNLSPPISPPWAISPRPRLTEKSLTNGQDRVPTPWPASPEAIPLRPTRPRANAMLSKAAHTTNPQSPPAPNTSRNTKARITKKSPLRSFLTLPSLDATIATSTSGSSLTTPATSVGPYTPHSAFQQSRVKQKSKPRLGLTVQPPTNMNVGIVPINEVTSPLSPYTSSSSKTEHPPPSKVRARPRAASPPTVPSARELALLWAEMERFKDVPLPLDDVDEYGL